MHKKIMADTKRVFLEMKQCEQEGNTPSTTTIADWRAVVRKANSEILHMARKVATDKERHIVEMSVISEEMRSELVDREANVARTAERFRVLQDRSGSTGNNTYERAVSSSSVIESAIAQICSHTLNKGNGPTLLYDNAQ
jgi:hypothetical protein